MVAREGGMREMKGKEVKVDFFCFCLKTVVVERVKWEISGGGSVNKIKGCV